MSLSEILAAIPHRPPFLLVDEIAERDDRRIVCRKRFTGDEFWFAGHYPTMPIVPGVLLCEAAMQAGAILLAHRIESSANLNQEKRVPVATRADDVRFKRMVRPGESIDIEVTLDEELSGAFYLTGKVTVDGKLAARLNFACTLTAAE